MFLVAKVIISLAVAGAVAWGLFGWHRPASMTSNTQGSTQMEQKTDVSGSAGTEVSVSGSSDAQLSSDLNGIDAQLQAASNDSAAIGESDKPIEQTE